MMEQQALALIVIDFQDKLLPSIPVAKEILARTVTLIRFARELQIPILWTEQYPRGLGPTAKILADELQGIQPLSKMTFGCLDDSTFAQTLARTGRRQLLLTGIEAHVCIMQTALQAVKQGFRVYVARDAIGSRTKDDCKAGLERMRHAGAELVTTEMAMFEVLRVAGTPQFKRVLPLIK